MKKPISHVIDEQAIKIFKAAFPEDAWTVYDIRPDYGKDHKVELVESEDHTGQTFWVQVKGQKKVSRLRNGMVSFKLETEYLDYHTKLTAPMFLVVVDVTKRIGYWVFTQKYERTQLRNVAWRRQQYIQIRLPSSNLLSDLRSLRAAVKDAIGYMGRLSLSWGISYTQESLKKLDPRFDVRVTATAQGEVIEATALEDFQVDLKFGAGFWQSGRLEDLLGRGFPVHYGQGEVVAEGSLLIESMLKETADRNGLLQLCLRGAGHVRLTHLDPQGNEVGRPCELACLFEGGLEEVRYQARTSYNNLVLTGACSARPETPMRLCIGYDLGCWLGRPLSSLSNFDLMSDLLGDLAEGNRMSVEFFAAAVPILSGYMVWNRVEMDSVRRLLGMVRLVGQARWIARTYKVDAVLPLHITEDHVQEITKLYRIARGEEIRLKDTIESASALLTKINMQTLSKVIGLDGQPLRLALVSDRPQPFLGAEVPIGPVETQLSHMRLAENREMLERQIQEAKTPIPLTWEATPETELVIRKVSKELLAAHQTAAEAQGYLE
jgi:Domain of unknown function (DUF4365)